MTTNLHRAIALLILLLLVTSLVAQAQENTTVFRVFIPLAIENPFTILPPPPVP